MRNCVILMLLYATLLASRSEAQMGRYDPSPAFTTTTIGTLSNIIAKIPNANVQICTFQLTGTSCLGLATTYTNNTGSTSCPSTAQIVLDMTQSCVSTTDSNGNFGFWATPGKYTFCINGAGVPPACFFAMVPIDPAAPTILTGNFTFQGTVTFSSPISVLGTNQSLSFFSGGLEQTPVTNQYGIGAFGAITSGYFMYPFGSGPASDTNYHISEYIKDSSGNEIGIFGTTVVSDPSVLHVPGNIIQLSGTNGIENTTTGCCVNAFGSQIITISPATNGLTVPLTYRFKCDWDYQVLGGTTPTPEFGLQSTSAAFNIGARATIWTNNTGTETSLYQAGICAINTWCSWTASTNPASGTTFQAELHGTLEVSTIPTTITFGTGFTGGTAVPGVMLMRGSGCVIF